MFVRQFVGTSLLFVYDRERVGIWLIDFGKTTEISELVEGGQITHDKPWELGNYEDGYFFGLRSLLTVSSVGSIGIVGRVPHGR